MQESDRLLFVDFNLLFIVEKDGETLDGDVDGAMYIANFWHEVAGPCRFKFVTACTSATRFYWDPVCMDSRCRTLQSVSLSA